MTGKILARGAEAIISKDSGAVVKERVEKSYRIRQIDQALRKKRTKLEARLIREARRAGVLTPQIIEENGFSIKMELVEGTRVKELVCEKNVKDIAEEIGRCVALMHNYDIIHGDLTTSNMIARARNSGFDIFFIDFGLGFISKRPEDKATDLHLLKEAIAATHFQIADKFWPAALSAYSRNYKDSEKVIKTLHKIEKRGRYVKRKAG